MEEIRKASAISDMGEADRYQLLVDAVVDYAIYMLDLEGRVVSWNSGGVRLKGYTAGEIIGQSFSRFYSVLSAHCVRECWVVRLGRLAGDRTNCRPVTTISTFRGSPRLCAHSQFEISV